MRKQGIYDNTRIILVADHGRDLNIFDGWRISGNFDIEQINPLLMVKDYNATVFETSDEFMANADVPTLAMRDIIENPINPFTGVDISNDDKTTHEQIITSSNNFKTSENNGYVFDTQGAPWYSVHDNIFDLDNWQQLD